MTQKRTGRRPLPDDQRRVQFGTRIQPGTLKILQAMAEAQDQPIGRIIDDLVARSKPAS